jgi:hypothetical protein
MQIELMILDRLKYRHTAKPLVPEPISFEFNIAAEKLNSY